MDLRSVDLNRLLAETSERLGEQGTHHERCVFVEVLADGSITSLWRGPGGGFATRCEADHLPMLGEGPVEQRCKAGDLVAIQRCDAGRGKHRGLLFAHVVDTQGESLHVTFGDGTMQWVPPQVVVGVCGEQ
jgi:hypothetical protein